MTTSRTPTFAQAAKHPAAFVLYIVIALIGYFAHSFTGESQGRTGDCKEVVAYLKAQIAHKDSVNEAMDFQLRVQQATTRQLPAVTDSLLRRK